MTRILSLYTYELNGKQSVGLGFINSQKFAKGSQMVMISSHISFIGDHSLTQKIYHYYQGFERLFLTSLVLPGKPRIFSPELTLATGSDGNKSQCTFSRVHVGSSASRFSLNFLYVSETTKVTSLIYMQCTVSTGLEVP